MGRRVYRVNLGKSGESTGEHFLLVWRILALVNNSSQLVIKNDCTMDLVVWRPPVSGEQIFGADGLIGRLGRMAARLRQLFYRLE